LVPSSRYIDFDHAIDSAWYYDYSKPCNITVSVLRYSNTIHPADYRYYRSSNHPRIPNPSEDNTPQNIHQAGTFGSSVPIKRYRKGTLQNIHRVYYKSLFLLFIIQEYAPGNDR
jgi:hypothetical protein